VDIIQINQKNLCSRSKISVCLATEIFSELRHSLEIGRKISNVVVVALFCNFGCLVSSSVLIKLGYRI
jgi:hypothetical protein